MLSGIVGCVREEEGTMSRPKRAPIPRVLAALLGALAILALVAGPSLAHPARLSPSRIDDPGDGEGGD